TTGGSGTPAQLSVNWLPDGVAFKDNGDGTANISGKIPSGFALICTGGGACPIVSFITAKNTWGSTAQKFTYITGYAPDAVLATTTATFIAGISNAVPVLSQGEQTPVTWGVGGPNLTLAPSGLSLTDQKDGTALLSGTPPLGSVGTHPLHVSVTAIGFSPFRVLDLSANFTLNVSGAPGFVSVDPGEFHVGQTSGVHIAGS